MNYPRVLVIALGRINAADADNNGLLLRNLFGDWPKQNLAQIYSSGDNGDEGFFGRYYQLGPQDRRMGHFFYALKNAAPKESVAVPVEGASIAARSGLAASLKTWINNVIVHTGIYELLFRPRLSRELLEWVKEFRPDILFAQGYSLTFAWLPVMLKKETGAALAFLTTDDWPTYLYSGQLGEPELFKWLVRPRVEHATRTLMAAVDIPFAFGQPMADEYERRYGNSFITISHADDPRRFEEATPLRSHPSGIISIVATGNFNKFRWPLLLDANECCRRLEAEGIPARIAVLSSSIDPAGVRELALASHVDLLQDPGNSLLPGYLKGADVLLLAEGFDEGFVSAISLSVSSKSHLFMFSRLPIIVYAHPDTGVYKYASALRWARTVGERDIEALLSAIQSVLYDENEARLLRSNAEETGKTFHLRETNEAHFLRALTTSLVGRE